MILLRIAPASACRTVIITGQQIGKVGARRVLDDVGQGAGNWTVHLVYGVLHGLVLPVWQGDGI
jgi:hypothetical protein